MGLSKNEAAVTCGLKIRYQHISGLHWLGALQGSFCTGMTLVLKTQSPSRAFTTSRGIIKKRPLVFIGHSLGGLIIKELLVMQNEPGGDETDMLNLRATGGALFFGVPHRGMDNSALLAAIGLQANPVFFRFSPRWVCYLFVFRNMYIWNSENVPEASLG
uniref:DUF676 domain-containing protein n=1 Tax=Fusarium oxysporum (strain Fo5176) TaxID=660025 RepID=A0A0D2XG25_FUSOF